MYFVLGLQGVLRDHCATRPLSGNRRRGLPSESRRDREGKVGMPDPSFEGLPGADLVVMGLADLERGVESIEALLVAIGEPRLRWNGISVPATASHLTEPERRLYRKLAAIHGNGAHSQYNALIRRLVSFEHALEHRRSRERRLANPSR